jgi:hypothetical protein
MIFLFLQFFVPCVVVCLLRRRSVRFKVLVAVGVSYFLTVSHHILYVLYGPEPTDSAGGIAFLVIFGGWIYPLAVSLLFVFAMKMLGLAPKLDNDKADADGSE